MASDVKRNTEVSIRWLSKSDKLKFEAAQSKEMDQWVENAVFSIARKAGVPVDRIMSMRWILTWKDAPENSVAKARLVIKGFQDPDLTTLRAEAPTLSKLADTCFCKLALQTGSRLRWGMSGRHFSKEIEESLNVTSMPNRCLNWQGTLD